MINRRHLLAAAVVLTAIGSTAASTAQAEDTIKMGGLATLEGAFTVMGEDALRGMKLALQEVNYTVAGKKIEVQTGSSDASPESAVKAARKLVEQGGVAAMGERNRAKADLLYGYIDTSGFYKNPVEKSARSWMNVPFTLPREELDAAFLKEAEAAGLMALKGHRAVGGMRASLYNAMPLEGVRALVAFMKDFAARNA